jgi:N4-(beta-N-acetylglucosaminyl)-L-asparaginase
MTTRRNFIKSTAFASAALLINKSEAAELNLKQNETTLSKPIVLSTWNFGLKANEAAWEVLSKNGKALDAVEAGVKVPEGDPTERSVGSVSYTHLTLPTSP